MLSGYDIKAELLKHKVIALPENEIIAEVNRILAKSAFSDKNILENLSSYKKTYDYLEEDFLDKNLLFKPEEIKAISVKLRLKFIASQNYPFNIPYEAIQKINELNRKHGKSLNGFKILGAADTFKKPIDAANFVLFAPTNCGNYYLIYAWGNKLKWYKKLFAFPLRSFESLAVTLVLFTSIVTLLLPTYLITLDRTVGYWCGYRAGTFFHLLIFFSGISAYMLVGFNKRFSGSVWQEENDYN